MKTLYIDCGMGAAGDMLTAALLEAAFPRGERDEDLSSGALNFIDRFNALGIPGVEMQASREEKQGIKGTHIHIYVNGEEEHEPQHHDHAQEHTHEHGHSHDHYHTHEPEHSHAHDHAHEHGHSHEHKHSHRSMKDIKDIIGGLGLDADIKADILSVYHIIAEAEGEVHGKPAGEVHFHEVGAMDAVADVTAVCMLMHEISADEVAASPVATGYGSVRCAHGELPVPAPATALILKGVPAYAGEVKGELCTPTGAALIKHFAQRYSQMPLMSTNAIGYGLGTKDFEKANVLRVFIGKTD